MWNVNQEISANRYRSKILQSDLWLGSCEYIKESLETRQAIELCNMLELNKSTFKFPGFAFAFLFALTFDLISEFTGHGCLLATVLLIDLLTICFAHHLTLYWFGRVPISSLLNHSSMKNISVSLTANFTCRIIFPNWLHPVVVAFLLIYLCNRLPLSSQHFCNSSFFSVLPLNRFSPSLTHFFFWCVFQSEMLSIL